MKLCQEHQQFPKSYYCKTCRKYACAECGMSVHRNHEIQNLKNEVQRAEGKIKEKIQELETLGKLIDDETNTLRAVLNKNTDARLLEVFSQVLPTASKKRVKLSFDCEFLSKDRIQLIIDVLRNSSSSHARDIVYATLNSLENIVFDAAYKLKFENVGICPLLVKVLEDYLGDRNMIHKGCGSLMNLAAQNESKFGEAGICPLLVKILRKYLEDRDVIYNGCRALCNLAVNAENKSKFRRVNISALLVEISQRFPSDTNILNLCNNFNV